MRSEVHPRRYWLAGSVINLGSFLLFLKEKLYHSSLMIKTDHDRLFPEFPAPSTLLVRWDNGWVHLSRRTMPTLCHQHHNDPATHRRDDGQQPCVCVAWFPRTVDDGRW